jgi:small acid-soluble spore protein F (minor alpha/beta-type SASP)
MLGPFATVKEGICAVGRRMSDELKWELAKELGVADLVRREGWGSVPARTCGDLVRAAIERAEQSLK